MTHYYYYYYYYLMCVDAAVKKSVTMERQEEILSKHIAIGEAQ